jgi:hypothetical protein
VFWRADDVYQQRLEAVCRAPEPTDDPLSDVAFGSAITAGLEPLCSFANGDERPGHTPIRQRLCVRFPGLLSFTDGGIDGGELRKRVVFAPAVFQFPPEGDGLFQALARLRLVAERELYLAGVRERSGHPRLVADVTADRQAALIEIERRVQFAERLMNEAQVAERYRLATPVANEPAQVQRL